MDLVMYHLLSKRKGWFNGARREPRVDKLASCQKIR